jgi:spore maturation protein SpmA
MNTIFLVLIVGSVVTAAFTGRMPAVTQASIDQAKAAVTLAIGLIGLMTFWLGLMNVVREGGLLLTLARWVRPLMTRLFPEVPPEHPAMSAMVMNITANMLGLGNAATPFGIKAMVELNRLNPVPGVATNSMALFLAINTSNVAVAPLGVIALRASLGSTNAVGIWIPTLIATSISTVAAILFTKLLQRFVPPVTAYAPTGATPGAAAAEELPGSEILGAERATLLPGCLLALFVVGAVAMGFLFHVREGLDGGETLSVLLRAALASWLLPVLIAVMLLYGAAKGVAVYDALVSGAKEGFQVAVRIIPFLVAILVAAGMFRASGLLDLLVGAVAPITNAVGFPAEALPMALLRPLSGSGAYAIMAEAMQTHGPDSKIGYLVSVLQGSTETTFYVLAVYFGAISVSRTRHVVPAGIIADAFGVIGSVLAVNWLLV